MSQIKVYHRCQISDLFPKECALGESFCTEASDIRRLPIYDFVASFGVHPHAALWWSPIA